MAKDGFQVDPATLDLVEVVEVLVEVCQPPLPQCGLVGKPSKIGRVFQRLQQTLVVSHLWHKEDVVMDIAIINSGFIPHVQV